MKRKLNFLILIIFCLLNLNFNAYAKSACENFYEDLKQNYNEYNLDKRPLFEHDDYGFELQTRFNKDKKDWEFDTNSAGYFKVGRLTDPNLIGKISENDLIISANGKDLRKENLLRNNKYLEDLFEPDETVNFVFENDKKFDLKLKRLIRDLGAPFTDIYVRSVEISEKTNKINAGLVLSFQYLRELAEDDPIYKSAIKNLMYETDDKKKIIETCPFTEYDWKSLRAFDPAEGLEFVNIHSINQSLLRSKYQFKSYSKEISEDVELGWGNDYTIDYLAEGIFTFKTSFDLRNFPFDKQKVEFYIANRNIQMRSQLTRISDYTKNELINFTTINNINGWDIVGNNLSYKPYKGPNDTAYFDGVVLELEIERKHSYYLYKVIVPILLILMVCWSSLWVTPKEIESRLTITIVCLLSLIAYNFVIDKEIPKLEYLTVLDWIILVSYIYATIPNFLSIYSHKLFTTNKKAQCTKIEGLGKKYGPTSYLLIVFLIIAISVNLNPENASAIVSWMGGVN
jgi:hypothetical protein